MKNNNHHHKNCLILFERLSEYIDRELDAATCQDIEAHIKACKPCQVCLETLKQTVNLCRNLERHRVPEAFSNRLKDSISGLLESQSNGHLSHFCSEDTSAPPSRLVNSKE
jgi:RNA polymerase sigma-70 factor (ECF subfamily)